jgi:hypothetical protein
MIVSRLHTLLLAIAAFLLAGCTHTIPLLSASIECPIKPEDLAAKCAAPAAIATGATYQDLVQVTITDRKTGSSWKIRSMNATLQFAKTMKRSMSSTKSMPGNRSMSQYPLQTCLTLYFM